GNLHACREVSPDLKVGGLRGTCAEVSDASPQRRTKESQTDCSQTTLSAASIVGSFEEFLSVTSGGGTGRDLQTGDWLEAARLNSRRPTWSAWSTWSTWQGVFSWQPFNCISSVVGPCAHN